jgi:hypothetical protein
MRATFRGLTHEARYDHGSHVPRRCLLGVCGEAAWAPIGQANRLDKSDMKTRPKVGRGPRLITGLKQIDRQAAIDAFEEQRSPRNLDRSPNASGLASVAADGLAVQSWSDQRLFVHNGIVHDIGNVLQALLSGLWVAQDRIREGRTGEVPGTFGEIGEAVDRANALLHQSQRIPPSPEKRTSAVDIGKVFARLGGSVEERLLAGDTRPIDRQCWGGSM